ncbi:glycosyltransferase family 4 protein [Thermocaproicibacter melissae]|uniref:glycosyltransferase family 4 protein n=1 Tax=Thermocaproicibacter melissae TaxID=2966552 RepID=UPI0024B0E795|nr:glycosyltransferase family 4 protein [Thermocaproicibacter melissae]WBY64488.1 glycosyltransferase family 4 protein [Thermocaproicibacter melissae]
MLETKSTSRKALIVANTGRFIALFELDNIRILQSLGYEVHCFADFHESAYHDLTKKVEDLGVIIYNADSFRSPFRLKNIKVYHQLVDIMNKNKFDFVDCHTPMGGVLARLAARTTKTRPIQYTAHGFHFFKGAPIHNWLCYYPVERFLSRFTDTLVTINHEDFERAKSLHAKRVLYIPGVGFDTAKFKNTQVDRKKKRQELGIPLEAFLIVSVGEINKNKNQHVIIEAISKISDFNPYYLICGEGPEKENLKALSKELGIEQQVIFLGFRNDIAEILKIADCFAFPSKREGLGIAALEAMASGLPIITSNASGILDYSENGKTGFICSPDDACGFANAICKLAHDENLRQQMSSYNQSKVLKYDIKNVRQTMVDIYKSI